MQALTISGLTKTYRGSVHALKGVELTVQEGDFFALLGPNQLMFTELYGVGSGRSRKTSADIS